MDLREKPGKIQKVLEILLRIRLISIVVMVVAAVSFLATNWQGVASLPIGASEALGMWMAEIDGAAGVWASAQFLTVAGIAAVVLFAVFGGVRSGIAAVVSFALAFGGLYILGGNESMPVTLFGALAVISMVAIILVKLSFACGLFPFVISWLFFTGFMAALPSALEPSWLVWAVLSALGFAGAMALSVSAGKLLGEGMPQAGALVKSAKRMVVPVMAASLLAVCAIAFDMGGAAQGTVEGAAAGKSSSVWGAILYFFVFNIWFFALMLPVMSFAPWERLRSGSRRVEMKDKKKKGAAKGKKK